ncbi:MAG: penicillin-binding protein activator [Paracoccaceae bacterium]
MRPTLSKAPRCRGLFARGLRAALAGLSLLAAACAQTGSGSGGGAGGATGQGPAVPPVPPVDVTRSVDLALLLPRTVENEGVSRLAAAISNAARLAIADVNDPVLVLREYDTAGQPERAVAAAEQAVAEGADLILGPFFGASTRAVAPVAGAAGLRVISFSTDLGAAGGPVYVSGYTPEAEARRILGYAARQGLRRIGVFRAQTAYGDAAAAAAGRAAADFGLAIQASLAYEPSFVGIEAASGPFAEEARAFEVDAVLLPAGGRELQATGSFLNFRGIDPQNVQYLGLGQWQSRASFDEPALQGGWFPAPDPVAASRFSARYAERYGERTAPLAALGYDAVAVAAQLVATARVTGSTAPFTDAAITRPQGFRGALGQLRFTPDGGVERETAILEVGNRRFVVREPSQLAAPGS